MDKCKLSLSSVDLTIPCIFHNFNTCLYKHYVMKGQGRVSSHKPSIGRLLLAPVKPILCVFELNEIIDFNFLFSNQMKSFLFPFKSDVEQFNKMLKVAIKKLLKSVFKFSRFFFFLLSWDPDWSKSQWAEFLTGQNFSWPNFRLLRFFQLAEFQFCRGR